MDHLCFKLLKIWLRMTSHLGTMSVENGIIVTQVCDGTFFPSLLSEMSEIVGCFNEPAQELLELHLASGFKKSGYILKKYDKIHYSKNDEGQHHPLQRCFPPLFATMGVSPLFPPVFFLDAIGLLTGLSAEREYLRDGKLTKMIVLAILYWGPLLVFQLWSTWNWRWYMALKESESYNTMAPGLRWYGLWHTRVLFCVYSMEGAHKREMLFQDHQIAMWRRLVALVYLETVTRYVKFTQDNAQCIPIVLAPFLDEVKLVPFIAVILQRYQAHKMVAAFLRYSYSVKFMAAIIYSYVLIDTLDSPFCQQVEAVLRNAKLLSYGESGKSSWQLILSASESLVTASRPAIGNMFKRCNVFWNNNILSSTKPQLQKTKESLILQPSFFCHSFSPASWLQLHYRPSVMLIDSREHSDHQSCLAKKNLMDHLCFKLLKIWLRMISQLVCDGTFFPSLLSEMSEIVGCFNEHAQELLELHLASGFKKYILWFKGKVHKNHAALLFNKWSLWQAEWVEVWISCLLDSIGDKIVDDNLTLLGEEQAKIVSFHIIWAHDHANWMEVFCNGLEGLSLWFMVDVRWSSIYQESRISMQISFRAFHLIIMISLSEL
ncbi:RING-type E3 ubiquitin transferase [Trifolium repens]|nr:RING-type E3 ubiquitin transferase [Trifolium repens]